MKTISIVEQYFYVDHFQSFRTPVLELEAGLGFPGREELEIKAS